MTADDRPAVPSLREASGDRPRIRGFDLCDELIGRRSFVAVLHLDIVGTLPDEATERMLDAALVTLIEHGLTPSAIAARLTVLGAPGQLQAAVAGGLLGAGDRYLGTIEQAAATLVAAHVADADPERSAAALVERSLAEGVRLPGFGHPIHREEDGRTVVLAALQRSLGLPTAHLELAEAIGRAFADRGRPLTLNAAGAIGAAVADLGLPPVLGRGLALIARSAGLVAHVLEEVHDPVAPTLWEIARGLPVEGASEGGASGPGDGSAER